VGQPLNDNALAILARQVKVATKAMGTTLVDVPYRRHIAPVLAQRVARRLWDSLGA
jgi:hypothetical protein